MDENFSKFNQANPQGSKGTDEESLLKENLDEFRSIIDESGYVNMKDYGSGMDFNVVLDVERLYKSIMSSPKLTDEDREDIQRRYDMAREFLDRVESRSSW